MSGSRRSRERERSGDLVSGLLNEVLTVRVRLRNAILLELNLNICITVIRNMSTKTCGILYQKML